MPGRAGPGRPARWPRRIGLMAALSPLVTAPAWLAMAGVLGTAPGLDTVAGAVLVSLLIACSYTDLHWRKIPNWATYTAVAWALLINAAGSAAGAGSGSDPGSARWAWLGAIGLGESLLGLGACFLVMFFVYRAAGSGAGDVKLAAALGALLGPDRGLNALVFAYIAAGAVIVAWSVWTVGPVSLFGGLLRRVGSLLLPGWVARPSPEQDRILGRPVPLAPFYGIGTLFVLAGASLR